MFQSQLIFDNLVNDMYRKDSIYNIRLKYDKTTF